MKILIDIKHPAQLNLFKGLARELQNEGWKVTISYLRRGKIARIIDKEYYEFEDLVCIGESNGTKWSIIWQGNIKRTVDFLKLIFREKYNITIAASSIPLAFASHFTSTPIIQFYDDPERKGVNRINSWLSTKLFFPAIIKKSKKIGTFNCLKEWSYLSPARFTPNEKVLQEYNLKAHDYIFIREVSNKSFNYFNQQESIVGSIANEITPNTKVILSLEDKYTAHRYPSDWIILQEPVSDIHSLIYYSKLVISSGDSMAREGAMLGVNSVYCGIRNMKANDILINKVLLHHKPGKAAVDFINDIISKPFDTNNQNEIRKELKNEWDDMIDFMKKQIYTYMKRERFAIKETYSPAN